MSRRPRVLAGAAAVVLPLLLASCASSPSEVYVGAPSFAPSTSTTTATPSAGPATPGMPGIGRIIVVRVAGLERRYRLHLPLTSPTGPRPLVIAYHGAGSSPAGLARDSGLDGAADRNGVVLVYPEAVGGRWSTGLPSAPVRNGGVDDVVFTQAILDGIGSYARVDKKRVAVAGIGDGALMALKFAAAHPEEVVGAVAIQGGLVSGDNPVVPKVPTSVTFIRGDKDPSLPWDGLPSRKDKMGPQLGMDDTISAYLAVDGLAGKSPTSKDQLPDRDPEDQTTVSRLVWGPGTQGRVVTLYKIAGGGGQFPGGLADSRDFAKVGRVSRDLSAAGIVVRFALETRLAK